MLESLKAKYIASGLAYRFGLFGTSLPPTQARTKIDALLEGSLKLIDLNHITWLVQTADIELSRQQAREILDQVPGEAETGLNRDRRSMGPGLVDTFSPFGIDWEEGVRKFRARALRVVLDCGPDEPEIPEAVMHHLCELRGKMPAGNISNMKLVAGLWYDAVLHNSADNDTWSPFLEELFSEHPDYQRGSGDYFGRGAASGRNSPVAGHPHHPYLTKVWDRLRRQPEFLASEQSWAQLEKLSTEPEHAGLIKKMLHDNPHEIMERPDRGLRGIQILTQAEPRAALDMIEGEASRQDWMGPDIVAPLLAHTTPEIRKRAMRLASKLEASCRPAAPTPKTGSSALDHDRGNPAPPRSPRR